MQRTGCAVLSVVALGLGVLAGKGAFESYRDASLAKSGKLEPTTYVHEGELVALPSRQETDINFAGDVLAVQGVLAVGVGGMLGFVALSRKSQFSQQTQE